ncbi:PLC-like protein [Mya arenaria]|uniref:PLC-like protein n=1 Tax=Mya arenaria TaxID=6604 RepID=A0ABY7G9T0_MYAAR|nr:PLC-like protein [Mya arenaria]
MAFFNKKTARNCYKAFGHKASWEGAVHHCMRYLKSILADLKDAQEQAYVRDNLLPDLTGNDDGVWLGARERRGRWTWVGGRSMDIHSFSWMEGNPDNGGLFNVIDTEDCLEMKKTGLLNDYKCSEKRPFICKMSNIEIPSTTIDNLLPALTGIGDGVWLGARQRLEDWQWVGGQTMDIDTFSWLAGNPDNGGWLNELSDEDCLEMKKTGLLNDYKCFEKRPFICKMSNIEVLTTRVGECFNRTCMTPQTLCHQATSTSTILSAQTS